jgi:hypothetical protein
MIKTSTRLGGSKGASILEAEERNPDYEYRYIDPELLSSRLILTHGPCFTDILRHRDSPTEIAIDRYLISHD